MLKVTHCGIAYDLFVVVIKLFICGNDFTVLYFWQKPIIFEVDSQ